MPMPAAIACCGAEKCIGWPSTKISPSSGRCIPYRIFMRVDLPAPFSPTIAWIVPLRTVRLTSELATTPGNLLVIPFSSTAGGSAVIERLLTDAGGGPDHSPPPHTRCLLLLGRHRD